MKKFDKELIIAIVVLALLVIGSLGIQWYFAKEWAEVLNVPFDFKFYLLYLFRK